MIKINGSKDLIRKLKDVPDKVINKGLRKGTRAAGKIVKRSASQSAPSLTGNLKRSFKVRALKRKVGRVGARVTLNLQGEKSAFYGSFQDLGFTLRNGKRIAGKHFMKKAISDNQEQIFKVIEDSINQAIKEAIK